MVLKSDSTDPQVQHKSKPETSASERPNSIPNRSRNTETPHEPLVRAARPTEMLPETQTLNPGALNRGPSILTPKKPEQVKVPNRDPECPVRVATIPARYV